MTKKNNFRQKLSLWPQDSLKIPERSKPLRPQGFFVKLQQDKNWTLNILSALPGSLNLWKRDSQTPSRNYCVES